MSVYSLKLSTEWYGILAHTLENQPQILTHPKNGSVYRQSFCVLDQQNRRRTLVDCLLVRESGEWWERERGEGRILSLSSLELVRRRLSEWTATRLDSWTLGATVLSVVLVGCLSLQYHTFHFAFHSLADRIILLLWSIEILSLTHVYTVIEEKNIKVGHSVNYVGDKRMAVLGMLFSCSFRLQVFIVKGGWKPTQISRLFNDFHATAQFII